MICLNWKNATIVENHWTWCEQAFILRLKRKPVKTGLQVSLHESNNSQQHYPLLMAEIQITLHFQLEGEPTNSRSLKYWWVRGDVWEKDFTSSDLGCFFSHLNLSHPCHQHSTNKSENEFPLYNFSPLMGVPRVPPPSTHFKYQLVFLVFVAPSLFYILKHKGEPGDTVSHRLFS